MAKPYKVIQRESKSPSEFYERLCEACRLYMPIDPEAAGSRIVTNAAFVSQAYLKMSDGGDTKVLGIQGCIKIHESLGVPPSDIFGVGLRHKGCIYHHLRPSSLWIYWCIKSIGLTQSSVELGG